MIRIYLDSSDYSVMSDPHGPEWAKDVATHLRERIMAGSVEVRFSALHVIETAHTNPNAKHLALERANLITEFSGRKCFKWHLALMADEAEYLAKEGAPPPQCHAFCDDGRWFPPMEEVALNIRKTLEKEAKDAFSKLPFSREKRRQLLKRYFHRGRLTNEGVARLRQGREQLLEDLKAQFPLPDRVFDEDIALSMATGSVSPKIFAEAIQETFCNLDVFVGWVYDKYDKNQELTRWLRSGFLLDTIYSAREKINSILEDAQKHSIDIAPIMHRAFKNMRDNLRTRLLTHIFDDRKSALRRKGIKEIDWQRKVISSSKGKIPSLDAFIDCTYSYAKNNATAGSTRRPKISDAADLFHLTYIPYVDIFRCDQYMASIAQQCARDRETKIVAKLRDLPTAIAELAFSRTQCDTAGPQQALNAQKPAKSLT